MDLRGADVDVPRSRWLRGRPSGPTASNAGLPPFRRWAGRGCTDSTCQDRVALIGIHGTVERRNEWGKEGTEVQAAVFVELVDVFN